MEYKTFSEGISTGTENFEKSLDKSTKESFATTPLWKQADIITKVAAYLGIGRTQAMSTIRQYEHNPKQLKPGERSAVAKAAGISSGVQFKKGGNDGFGGGKSASTIAPKPATRKGLWDDDTLIRKVMVGMGASYANAKNMLIAFERGGPNPRRLLLKEIIGKHLGMATPTG